MAGAALLIVGMFAVPRSAAADPVHFDIKAQDLATALNQFAQQAQVQVTLAPGIASGRQSIGVSGDLEPADALRRLIGRQLSFEFIDPHSVVIRQSEARAAVAPPAAVPATAEVGSDLDEVVVTARRREEVAQTIPLAITAFTQEGIERQQIHDIRDLALHVPSVASQANQSDSNAPFSSILRLRGLPGTEIYFAEVPLGNADYQVGSGLTHGLSEGNFYDLQDVEIIKGPQGTLFGKNSVGGLISVQPKHPTDDFEGYLRTTFGNYNDQENEFAVNVPIVDEKVLLRVAGQSQQRDGYTQDLANGKDLDNKNYFAWRVGLTVRPTDDFENYLLYDGYWQDTNGSSAIVSYINPKFAFGQIPLGENFSLPLTLGTGPNFAGLFNPGTAGATVAQAIAAGGFALYPDLVKQFELQQKLGARTVIGDDLQGIGRDYFYGVTDVATWNVNDELTIKNIAAARVFKQLATDDFSPIGLKILYLGLPGNNGQWANNEAQYTEELQFQGKSLNDRLDWVAGGFLEFDHPIGDSIEGSSALIDTPVGAPAYNHYRLASRSQALFAHATYDFSDYIDGLKLTGGYRYTWDFVSDAVRGTSGTDAILRNAAGVATNCTGVFLTDNNCYESAPDGHFSSPGWNVSLEEQFTPMLLAYVRAGNAYRPGGANLNVPGDFASFGPEHITDVELGMKADWNLFGIRGRTDADIYHSDYKAIQVLHNVQLVNGAGAIVTNQLTGNAASAELEGGELEATVAPVEGLEITPHASYLHAFYNQYPSAFSVRGADTPFIFSPKWSWGVTGTYHLPVDPGLGDVSVSATYSFYGHQYTSTDVTELYPIQQSYDSVDLRMDWDNIGGRPFDASFFMTNVLDNLHPVGAVTTSTALGFSSLIYDQPRMFGFSLKWRFGPSLDSGLF